MAACRALASWTTMVDQHPGVAVIPFVDSQVCTDWLHAADRMPDRCGELLEFKLHGGVHRGGLLLAHQVAPKHVLDCRGVCHDNVGRGWIACVPVLASHVGLACLLILDHEAHFVQPRLVGIYVAAAACEALFSHHAI